MSLLTTIIVLFLLGLITRIIIGIKQNKQWAKIIVVIMAILLTIMAILLTIFALLIILSLLPNMS